MTDVPANRPPDAAALIVRTACRVFGRDWDEMVSPKIGRNHPSRIIDRAVTALVVHRRTAATNAQTAELMGHSIENKRKNYTTKAKRMIRNALDAGDHLVAQRVALLDAAVDRLEESGAILPPTPAVYFDGQATAPENAFPGPFQLELDRIRSEAMRADDDDAVERCDAALDLIAETAEIIDGLERR